MKRLRQILPWWPCFAASAVLGFVLMQYAGFLEADCHLHPVNNARCWEKDAYAWAGLLIIAVAGVAVVAAAADALYRRIVARRSGL